MKMLFGVAEDQMKGSYHEIYQRLGWRLAKNGNFHCFNESSHANGIDSHPSFSVNRATGQWHCFTCGVEGNFQKYWKEYIKGGEYGDHYHDFLIDFLNLQSMSGMNDDKISDGDISKLKDLYNDVKERHKKEGRYFSISDESLAEANKASTLDMAELDGYVKNLLNNQGKLDYLKKTRNVSPDLVNELRLGLDDRGNYIFPIIDGNGLLLNMKAYNPTNPNFKWSYKYKGLPVKPTPIESFTKNKIYIYEGEPDMICSLGFGIEGSGTMGAAVNRDVVKVFGLEIAKMFFTGKEIVICMDGDEEGIKAAKAIAKSVYPFAKQIKIIDFNYDEKINPFGLDPRAIKDVKGKSKKSEKDFTDYMHKNGFGKEALSRFYKLEADSPVYTENADRIKVEEFKVSIQEARDPKYFDYDGNKRLVVSGTISDFDERAYFYDKSFFVTCPMMGDKEAKLFPCCKRCLIPNKPGFDKDDKIEFKFIQRRDKTNARDPLSIKISGTDLLGLIETTNTKRITHQRNLCGISSSCTMVKLIEGKQGKLLHVKLSRDVSQYGEVIEAGNSEIEIDAYIKDDDVLPGKAYKTFGIQAKGFDTQTAVLIIDKVEPIGTSIDNFIMTPEIDEILRVFRPRDGESIDDHLKRRYKIFGAKAGITGRDDLFMLCDLAYFSSIEIKHKLFPTMKRGWVEVAIIGTTRCGKTLVTKFLMNQYQMGEMISGSSGLSRSGLIGGVSTSKNRNRIKWGRLPQNDGGLVILDEVSNMDKQILTEDLTYLRSEGVAEITMVENGKAPARVRKIMLSNLRGKDEDHLNTYGMEALMNVFIQEQVVSRFDAAMYVKSDDVDFNSYHSTYSDNSVDFNKFQCKNLITWVYSRTADDYLYEDGLDIYLTECQNEMLKTFHEDTLLVNQESRLKLLRCSGSLAGMLYSTHPDDYNKVLVKKEHVKFVMDFLTRIYKHKNMQLDKFSDDKRCDSKLGNMDFMENIIKIIDGKALLRESEYHQNTLQQIFFDYLEKVREGIIMIVDAKYDYKLGRDNMSKHLFISESIHKLIATMVTRNCLTRKNNNRYCKTHVFKKWLEETLKKDENVLSSVLEPTLTQSDIEKLKDFQKFKPSTQSAKRA